jgi:predicted lipoprotein with Yx(FWY)xxD motif
MSQKQHSRRTRFIGAALVAGVALLAAACGGGTSSADKTSTAAAKGGAAATATKPAAAAATSTKAAASPTAANTAASGAPTAAATSAAGGATGVKTGTTALGEVLTDASGMTLYIFKSDVAGSGTSACSPGCVKVWPPLATTTGAPSKPPGVTGDFAVITRDDLTMQVTYKGQPLYHFINDKAPGDTMGEGVAGLWTVAKP